MQKRKGFLKHIDDVAGQIDGEMKKGDKADEESIAAWREQLQALQREHKEWVVKDEISALYSQNGAEGLNASTGYDITTYKVSLPSNRVELWASIESDRMAAPVFREFYSEREVVREERRQREETQPEGKLMENFLAASFTGHPYGRPIIGWDRDLQYLQRNTLEQFFHNYYAPNNAVIAVVGAVKADEMMAIIERYFANIPSQEISTVPEREQPQAVRGKTHYRGV